VLWSVQLICFSPAYLRPAAPERALRRAIFAGREIEELFVLGMSTHILENLENKLRILNKNDRKCKKY